MSRRDRGVFIFSVILILKLPNKCGAGIVQHDITYFRISIQTTKHTKRHEKKHENNKEKTTEDTELTEDFILFIPFGVFSVFSG